ncbi:MULTISPECIES: DUF721 domain-containing protein [Vibrio]|jgi:hypothetical protein|uniref:DUF721 domain-containing protein n=1 Tax=Vibrio TaxID=662 RepID=UPI000C000594|nr:MULTISPECIES: DciA family protein [unclassified Vibrio]PHJ42396.1 hypothetical protein AK965_06275 [Vibrio sp. PID17_43]RIZ54649.1 hypothetical protein AK966_09535 [Vibrio sp. PID23_8]
MRDHRPTATDDLIAESQFKQIQQHAGEILQLNQALQSILPKGTADHCRVANIRNGHLLIDVSSAAIKMKVDYDRLMILNKLRTQGYAKLMSVEVRINPSLYRNRFEHDDRPKRPPLTEAAANSLMIIADIAPPKIKERLKRLADMAEKKSNK